MDYIISGVSSYNQSLDGHFNNATFSTRYIDGKIRPANNLNVDLLNTLNSISKSVNPTARDFDISKNMDTLDSDSLNELVSELPSPESFRNDSKTCSPERNDPANIDSTGILRRYMQVDHNTNSTYDTGGSDTLSSFLGNKTNELECCDVAKESINSLPGNQCTNGGECNYMCYATPLNEIQCSFTRSDFHFDSYSSLSCECADSDSFFGLDDFKCFTLNNTHQLKTSIYPSLNQTSVPIPHEIDSSKVSNKATIEDITISTIGSFNADETFVNDYTINCDMSFDDVDKEFLGAKLSPLIDNVANEDKALTCESFMIDDNETMKNTENEPSVGMYKWDDCFMPNDYPTCGILPRCRVCSRKATGFHYGVYTCEACKGFYRRALAKGSQVVFPCRCAKNGSTGWKTGPVKNGCPSCRYKRCILVGMDKNAIKKGRYTLEQKHKHIDEMQKMLKLYRDKSNHESQHKSLQNTPNYVRPCPIVDPVVRMTDVSLTKQSIEMQNLSMFKDQQQMNQRRISEGRIIVEDIDELVDTLQNIVKKNCPLRHLSCQDKMERMKQRHADCIHQYNMKKALFGEMRPLSKQEHLEIYTATGIDVDDRFDDVRGAFAFFERKVRGLIEYAKAIPGFTDLHLDDQANLIKGSRAMSTFIGSYKRFLRACNMELQVIAVPWGKAYHINELTKIYPRDYFLLKFQLAQEMKNLGLTKKEEFVMRAISITLGDRCQLKESAKVHAVNARLMQYFRTILSKRILDPNPMIKNVFAMFLKLRELTDSDNKVLKDLFQGWPALANHRLLHEFFS